ncbi:hypothetical protein DQ384_01815 [Sphaerisporangium album]|uniref:Uncharacterized protein n=2 Tax=Sphaerisporangium album TaxID=509200 RepID=A0A367FS01_9ACTN|nr:hypothetical protein DQ384_01815 [Sphaerisporangium album]
MTFSLSSVAVLAACTPGPATAPAGSSGSSEATAPAGGGSASPTVDVSATYRTTLATAAGPLRTALDGLAKSRSMKSLDQRLERAQNAASDAVEGLSAATPPPDVTAEHTDYLAALRGLEGDLGTLRDGVAGHDLCAPSAVLARLGKAGGFGEVRSAGGDLAAKGDYPADVAKLRTPKERSRRLANGAFVRRGPQGGLGRLTVKNGGRFDTVLSVVRGKSAVTRFYIRKNKSVTVTGVPDGTYKVYYTSGADWENGSRLFTRDCVFKRFDKPLSFRTVRGTTMIRRTIWTISLQSVLGGNATSSEVDPDEFPR